NELAADPFLVTRLRVDDEHSIGEEIKPKWNDTSSHVFGAEWEDVGVTVADVCGEALHFEQHAVVAIARDVGFEIVRCFDERGRKRLRLVDVMLLLNLIEPKRDVGSPSGNAIGA